MIKAESGAYDYGATHQTKEASEKEAPAPQEETNVSQLNVLKAQIMRAELQGNGEAAAKLQQQYDALAGTNNSANTGSNLKVLDSVEIQKLHQIQAKQPKSSEDMSIADMVREEKLNAGSAGNQELDMARQIGKDSGYEGDTDYAFENADKLAKSHVVSAEDARKKVLERTRMLNTITDHCSLCVVDQDESSNTKKVVPISIGTRVYLCAGAEPALTKGVSVIVPMDHHRNTLECDDDEWEEIRNFMKCLTRLWAAYNRQVLFYENAVPTGNSAGDRMHACIYAVPVSASNLEAALPIFREAMETGDEEWSTHRKVINTLKAGAAGGDAARFAFRTSIAKEAPYFHVWFNINGGLGHIVEDRAQWPRGDMFAREIIGNLLRTDLMVIRKHTRWSSAAPKFVSKWPEFDWTKQLE